MVDSNRICKRHWTERKKWYEDEERNAEIQLVEMKLDEKFLGNSGISTGEMTNEQVKVMNQASINRAKIRIMGLK